MSIKEKEILEKSGFDADGNLLYGFNLKIKRGEDEVTATVGFSEEEIDDMLIRYTDTGIKYSRELKDIAKCLIDNACKIFIEDFKLEN